jgi:hypothetical protein
MVCQAVKHIMFHLNNNQHKHSSFSNAKSWRRTTYKYAEVLVVISVGLLHQQRDKKCEIQHWNADMEFHILSPVNRRVFLFVPPVCCFRLDNPLDDSVVLPSCHHPHQIFVLRMVMVLYSPSLYPTGHSWCACWHKIWQSHKFMDIFGKAGD